jgi:hypothetical protein
VNLDGVRNYGRRPRSSGGPTIAGTVSGLTTTSETSVKPFTHVTVGDANLGATDTQTITLGGAGGTNGTGLRGVGGLYAGSGRRAWPSATCRRR